MTAILILADSPKSIASVLYVVWHQKLNLKSIGENDSKDIAFTRGIYSIYLKKLDGGHLVFTDGPKSIASVILVILYDISNLKSIGETVLRISHSQVGRTEGQTDKTDGRKDGMTEEWPNVRTDGLRLRRTKMYYYLSLSNVTFLPFLWNHLPEIIYI